MDVSLGLTVLLDLGDEDEQRLPTARVTYSAHHVGLAEARRRFEDGDLGRAVRMLPPRGPGDRLLEPRRRLFMDRGNVQGGIEAVHGGDAVIDKRVTG